MWRLGQVMDTKFGTNVANRMLLNAAKFQSYSFYRFWVIKRKPTGGVKLPPAPPPPSTTQIRVKSNMLIPIQVWVLRFITHLADDSCCSIKQLFSLLSVGLNDHFKYCLLIVNIFTSILFIRVFINLSNKAMLFDLSFWFLTLLPSFSASFCKFA